MTAVLLAVSHRVASGWTSSFSELYLLATYGLIALAVILIAETGLLLGFFLPGDSLLSLAGAYAAPTAAGRPHPSLAGVLVAGVAGALLPGERVSDREACRP